MREISNATVANSGFKDTIVDMAINSRGIRDTARALKINKNTVIRTLIKKQNHIVQVKPLFYTLETETPLEVRLERVCDAAELDEQWSLA